MNHDTHGDRCNGLTEQLCSLLSCALFSVIAISLYVQSLRGETEKPPIVEPARPGEAIAVSFDDLFRASFSPEMRDLLGACPCQIKGQFSPSVDNDKSFYLIAFDQKCCPADVVVHKLLVLASEKTGDSFRDLEWLVAEGSLQFYRTTRNEFTPVLRVGSMNKVQKLSKKLPAAQTMLPLILSPKFHLPILWGGLLLLIMVVIQAAALWRSARQNVGHHHTHAHWRFAVLLLPVCLFFLNLPNQPFSKEFQKALIKNSGTNSDILLERELD